MSWSGVNLEKVLQREKKRNERKGADETLKAFKELLGKEDEIDDRILKNIFGSEGCISQLDIKKLSPEYIYSGAQLKKLCTDYRLRLLDSKYFKAEIPYEAIAKLKRLQRIENAEIEGFKIMAPAGMFDLRSKDRDPLLFIPLGKDRYYLVHKWGSDLSIWRRWLVFPFRNFKTLVLCVAVFALLVVMAIPDSVMSPNGTYGTGSLRVICFFYFFIATSGLTALYGFSRMKDFNSRLWDSKYLD